MADCHDLFEKFNGKIILSDSKRNNLKKARKALRDRIRNHFKNTRKEKAPLFAGQGSFYMDTIVNPIDGEYDIDDGVYLQNLDEDKTKWPSSETVHGWIYEAVDGHTDQKPQDKRTCIRVLYSREKGQDYHVDLPVYGVKDKVAYLAEKGKSPWPESDPKSFIEWFENHIKSKGEQLRRMVCYLKAWADHNQKQVPTMLNGISWTTVTTEQFFSSQQDDQALVETIKSISNKIRTTKTIRKPVKPNENLLEGWSAEDIAKLCDRMDVLAQKGTKALNTDDKEEASLLWIGQFGSRFPKYDPPEEDEEKPAPQISPAWVKKSPSILGGNPKG